MMTAEDLIATKVKMSSPFVCILFPYDFHQDAQEKFL